MSIGSIINLELCGPRCESNLKQDGTQVSLRAGENRVRRWAFALGLGRLDSGHQNQDEQEPGLHSCE